MRKKSFGKKKILLIGGSSLFSLNWALQKSKDQNIILGLHKKNVKINSTTSVKFNFLDNKKLFSEIRSLNPSVIVLTSAITSIEKCEQYKKNCKLVNYYLAKKICDIAKKIKIKLVFISTDQLFDGRKNIYTEKSVENPQNYYAKTKLMAENYIKNNHSDHIIVRTNFFGWGPSYRRSFSDVIIETIKNNTIFYGYDNIFYTPILVNDLINIICAMIEKNAKGTFNIVGAESISKYNFALKLIKLFNLNTDLLKKRSYLNQQSNPKRPKNMCLSAKKLNKIVNIKTYDVNKSLIGLKLIKRKIFNKINNI